MNEPHARFAERLESLGRDLSTIGVDGGGGGGDDGGMEPRVAKLEATSEYIQRDIKELKDDLRSVHSDITGIRTTDFRLIFGAIIAVALGLATLMAKGFHWI